MALVWTRPRERAHSRSMKALVAAFVLVMTLGAPAVAHADQGPGYGGDADSLEVTWKENKDKALAAPPPVPSDENDGDAPRDPDRMSLVGDAATLEVDGIGFRGLSEIEIQFGSEDPVAVRADQTGTVVASFPGTQSADPGTTVVAIGRSPSGATRTLVGSVPPLPHGTNLMGLVTWAIVAPVVLIAGSALLRHRPRRRPEVDAPLLAPAPAGPPVAGLPMPAPTSQPIMGLSAPRGQAPPMWYAGAPPTVPPQGPPVLL